MNGGPGPLRGLRAAVGASGPRRPDWHRAGTGGELRGSGRLREPGGYSLTGGRPLGGVGAVNAKELIVSRPPGHSRRRLADGGR